MLLAYIPTSKLEGILNKTGRRRAVANLYHACMELILKPISSVGEAGISMMSGDGIWRRCHPILASFVGDYPEQVLVTCTYNNQCPKCLVPRDELGSPARYPPRDYDKAREAYLLANGNAHVFHAACREAGQKPVYHPFWESLPLSNIFVSITPDILHQLLQGVFKNMVAWLIRTFGAAEIDARCRSLPPNHHISIFAKGISGLSRITGKEHKNISRILLGLVMDLPIPDGQVSQQVLAVVRALLDFLYLAQLPACTSAGLARMEDALSHYHSNKDIFIDLGIQEHFNMPKIHSLTHYTASIQLLGTTDNYNTEQTEWLHIDMTKDAYDVTNHKDEYSQMTTWQKRHEKVQVHYRFVKWRQQSNQEHMQAPAYIGPPCPVSRSLKMAQNPMLKAVSFNNLAYKYGAIDFQDALADFIAWINNPTTSGASLLAMAADTLIPFRTVPVYHRLKFTSLGRSEIVDSVLVWPEQKDARGRLIPSQFDTILVYGKTTSDDFVCGNNGK